MASILITAIGGDIAQAAALIVRQRFPSWKIFGIDVETRHGGSLFVDCFDLAPRAESLNYSGWLTDYIKQNKIDYCIPLSEAELTVLAAANEDVLKATKLIWAGPKAILIGSDKLRTADFIKNIGVTAPWTMVANESSVPPNYPCIFKLRYSAGSKAVFICHNISDVKFFCKRYPDAVLQEYLPDSKAEITCAVYRATDGQIRVLQMNRRLTGGLTGWARVINDPEVEAHCIKIAEELSLQGAINIQLRLTESGPRIFEINPRFSSTLLMRHQAGFTDLYWALKEAQGQQILFDDPIVSGTTLVRTYGAAVTSKDIRLIGET
jgi:carbamoyl-phosphate synthase large subunit